MDHDHNLEGDGVSNPVTLNVRCKCQDHYHDNEHEKWSMIMKMRKTSNNPLNAQTMTKTMFQTGLTAERTKFKCTEWRASTGFESPARLG